MPKHMLKFTLNGRGVECRVPPDARLLDVLRYDCGLTGTKEGCGEGECGACTVLLDGLPVNACLVAGFQAEGRSVTTVEGIEPAIADTLNAAGAAQCGACTPGIVMTARWLMDHPQILEDMTLRQFMSGNLCRCTGYDAVIDGIRHVLNEGASPTSLATE